MKTIGVVRRIKVSADAVWQVIRAGDRMDLWSPAVSSCRLEGSGVGARRVCVINERELNESIETIDDSCRLFQYRIVSQSLLPVKNVLGTIHVSEISESEAQVLWFANLEMIDESQWPGVEKAVNELYGVSIDGLAAYCGA